MNPLRHALAAAAAASIGVAAFAQPAVPDPPTHVVRIDAIAVDGRGRLVEDLKPADFELREDDVLQPIESAPYVRPGGARRLAIFLDEYHVSAGAATDRVRDVMTRFVEQSLRPDDQVAVMKPLDSLFAIQ